MNAIREVSEIRNIFKGALTYLETKKEEVNNLNVFPVPDGDTGTNMYLTMASAIRAIDSVEPGSFTEFADALSKGALMGARGNSGVILSQIFRGFAMSIHDKGVIDSKILADCFRLGSEIAYKAVKKPVKGTILTVMDGIWAGASESLNDKDEWLYTLEKGILGGRKALEETPELLPVLKEAGVVDAGGYGLLVILEGMYKTALGDQSFLTTIDMVLDSPIIDESYHSLEDIRYGYCTEFIILNPDKDNETIREALDKPEIGDSLVTIVADGIAKVHIHTNNPGQVLEYALSVGSVTNIKIDNMRQQFLEEQEKKGKKPKKQGRMKEHGFVMVVPGSGLGEIAQSMGVDAVLDGGQTMNPSTHDIQEAIETVHARTIYVFPNNKNIILSAEQTVNLNNDKKVIVVPSMNVQQGFAAVLAFREDKEPLENLRRMKGAFGDVRTGAITYAVRDTKNKGMKIKKDQILVLGESEILAAVDSIQDGIREFLRQAYDGQEIMTLYYGDQVKEQDAMAVKEQIEAQYPDLEVMVFEGKQPVYFYFLSLE